MLLFISLCLLHSFISTAQKKHIINTEVFISKNVSHRNISIYTPPGYDYNKKQSYDVLYMQDGQNLFDGNTAFGGVEWRVDEVMDSLIKQKKIKPCIIVGIWNSDHRFEEYLPYKPLSYGGDTLMKLVEKRKPDYEPLSDAYLKFIVTELKPYIDKKYRTNPLRTHTQIAGSSMGGLISLYAVMEYPEVFGSAACISTHWPVVFNEYNNTFTQAMMNYIRSRFQETSLRPILYFDYGTETLDHYYEPCQRLMDKFLLENQFDFTNWITRRFPGAAHNEASWSRRMNIVLGYVLKKRKD